MLRDQFDQYSPLSVATRRNFAFIPSLAPDTSFTELLALLIHDEFLRFERAGESSPEPRILVLCGSKYLAHTICGEFSAWAH